MQGHASETFQNEEGIVHAGKEGKRKLIEHNNKKYTRCLKLLWSLSCIVIVTDK